MSAIKKLSHDSKVIWLSRLLIVTIFFTLFLFPTAYAEEDPYYKYGLGLSCFQEALMIRMAPQMIIDDVINENGYFGRLKNYVLRDEPKEKDTSITDNKVELGKSTLTTDFKVVYNLILLLGFTWMLIQAISTMIMAYEQDKDPQEAVYKCILQIGVAGILMCQIPNIVNFIADLGESVLIAVSKMSTNGDDMTPVYEQMQAFVVAVSGDEDVKTWYDVADKGAFAVWLFDLQVCAKLTIPSAISIISRIIAEVVIGTYYVELGIRKLFVPLAVADIYKEGMRSSGMRYLKKMFSVFLKIVICIVSLFISVTLLDIAADNIGTADGYGTIGAIVVMVVSLVIGISMMTKGAIIADEAIGA